MFSHCHTFQLLSFVTCFFNIFDSTIISFPLCSFFLYCSSPPLSVFLDLSICSECYPIFSISSSNLSSLIFPFPYRDWHLFLAFSFSVFPFPVPSHPPFLSTSPFLLHSPLTPHFYFTTPSLSQPTHPPSHHHSRSRRKQKKSKTKNPIRARKSHAKSLNPRRSTRVPGARVPGPELDRAEVMK